MLLYDFYLFKTFLDAYAPLDTSSLHIMLLCVSDPDPHVSVLVWLSILKCGSGSKECKNVDQEGLMLLVFCKVVCSP